MSWGLQIPNYLAPRAGRSAACDALHCSKQQHCHQQLGASVLESFTQGLLAYLPATPALAQTPALQQRAS